MVTYCDLRSLYGVGIETRFSHASDPQRSISLSLIECRDDQPIEKGSLSASCKCVDVALKGCQPLFFNTALWGIFSPDVLPLGNVQYARPSRCVLFTTRAPPPQVSSTLCTLYTLSDPICRLQPFAHFCNQ
jgi:hypothetical protein